MKIQFMLVPILFAFSLTACERETINPEPEDQVITELEAVEIVEGALSSRSSGVSSDALDAASLADNYAEKSGGSPCGMIFDSTVIRDYSNAYITANYSTDWQWEVLCNDLQIPITLNYLREMEGAYATNRMESDDSATASWTIDHLFGGQPYAVNGTYTRLGYQESLIREMRAFNSEVFIEVENLIIDKDDHRIESGMASFTLTGEVVDGESFNISGDIIFLGDFAANIIINGTVYTIEL